jgi:hypothetical protein
MNLDLRNGGKKSAAVYSDCLRDLSGLRRFMLKNKMRENRK